MGIHDLFLRLRALLMHRRAESELDEELRFHLEMEARKKRLAGIDEARARQSARAGFGGVEQVREQCRDARGITFIENLARDVRYGARVLWRTPVFTTVAIISLAIGIGANTAVFSLVDTVLLKMLPVKNPEELVVLKWGARTGLDLSFSYAMNSGGGHGGWTANVVSWRIFSEMRNHSGTIESVMGFSWLPEVNVVARRQALVTGGMVVSGNYFSTLGAETLMGRPILDDDDTAEGAPAAVISYRFWDQVFGLDPAALGATIYVNGQACTVVGVTRSGFIGVSPGGFHGAPRVDITLPIRAKERLEGAGASHTAWFADDLQWVQVMGRLKPQHAIEAAEGELAALVSANLPEIVRRRLGSDAPRVQLEPGSRGLGNLREVYRKPLLILAAVVGLTLLMACANLAGLLLARATGRQKEILLRLAVGAGRWRLVRQLLVEGALLAALGAAAGLAFAWWGVQGLLALAASGPTPIFVDVRPDGRVLAFTAAVSALTTLLFALAPTIRATRVDVANGLKEDSPMAPGGHLGGERVLVAIQIAVALLLVTGATLFTRTLANLRSLPLGFNTNNLVVFDIAPGRNGYDEVRGNQLYARVLDRIRQTPGIVGASLATHRLITGWMSNGGFLVEGSDRGKEGVAHFNYVGPDFFQVMQIPVVLGRGIEQRDMAATPRVAVINETLARESFGAGSPVGMRFRWSSDDEQDVEVVGVAKDAQYAKLREAPPPTIYVPYTQRRWGWPQQMSFQVRIAGNPAEAVARIRNSVSEVDRMLPLIDLKTMEGQIEQALAQERLFASLISLFGAITLVLACVGLYGMVSYAVASRTREIGVRMALGADRASVMRMVLRQVAGTTLAGLVAGVPAAVALARVVESQLYGVKAHDPASLAVSAVGIVVVAWMAAFFPARRAMRVDPVRALRYG